MEPSTNIIITDNGIVTKAYDYKSFEISFATVGTSICLAIDNGIDPELYLYGDEVECQTDAVRWASGQYNPTEITNPFKVTYQYTREDTYLMTVIGYNSYNWTTSAKLYFTVTSIDCKAPNIDLEDRKRFFNYPHIYKKSLRHRIVGITDIACPDTLNNVKAWTAELWDEIDDISLGNVDLTSLESSINSELSIPALFLPYGLYKLNYKVTMLSDVHGEGFFGEAETFIRIDKSDLVVQVYDGGITLATKGPSVEMTLAPRDFSYDPDDPTSVSKFVFMVNRYTLKGGNCQNFLPPF